MDLVDNISDGVERSLMVNKAKALILRLPPNQKIALEMAFFDGLTHAEIAEKLQIPLGTIKTRIRTAIQTLGTALRSQSHRYP